MTDGLTYEEGAKDYRGALPHPETSDLDPTQQDLPDYLDPGGTDDQVFDDE